jgi:FkbM family methyltransferase
MVSLAAHEQKFLESMKQELVDDPHIVDVGANVGQFAIACKQIWPPSFITCFEPSVSAFNQLVRNTRPWQDSMSLNWCALGESRDVKPLYSGPGADETASLHRRWLPGIGYLHGSHQVQMVDVWALGALMVRDVDLLKIDAEGHELAVLKGLGRELRRERVKRIYFEFNSCALDSRVYFRDFWRLLVEECGYQLWQVTSNGDLDPIGEYDPSLEDFAAHREFYAK